MRPTARDGALARRVGRRVPVPVQLAVALAATALAVATWATPGVPAQIPQASAFAPGDLSALEAGGRALFLESCSTCHGQDARGVPGRAPSLIGAGEASVDFYVRTGRMPLARPGIQPQRADPVFTPRQIDALVAYVGGLGDGPAIPVVRPERGDVAEGRALFADSCSGCHQIVGQGGIATGLVAPALEDVEPVTIGEAIRVGPYLMPRFSEAQLPSEDVDSIARYMETVVADPPDEGGWGIGNIGPIPEGVVAFLLAGTALVLVARIIGERSP